MRYLKNYKSRFFRKRLLNGKRKPAKYLEGSKLSSVDIVEEYHKRIADITLDELNIKIDKILNELGRYKIGVSEVYATVRSAVTLFEIVPEAGVRIAKIKALKDNIEFNLADLRIKITVPLPGKGTLGIEVPNLSPKIVSVRLMFKPAKF